MNLHREHHGIELQRRSPGFFLFCFVLFFFNLFICLFWLCWVLVSVRGLSLVASSGGHSSWATLHRGARASLTIAASPVGSTGSRRAGSVAVARGPSCSAACGISQTRARTRVPCIGRQTPNHRATREAHSPGFDMVLQLCCNRWGRLRRGLSV